MSTIHPSSKLRFSWLFCCLSLSLPLYCRWIQWKLHKKSRVGRVISVSRDSVFGQSSDLVTSIQSHIPPLTSLAPFPQFPSSGNRHPSDRANPNQTAQNPIENVGLTCWCPMIRPFHRIIFKINIKFNAHNPIALSYWSWMGYLLIGCRLRNSVLTPSYFILIAKHNNSSNQHRHLRRRLTQWPAQRFDFQTQSVHR